MPNLFWGRRQAKPVVWGGGCHVKLSHPTPNFQGMAGAEFLGFFLRTPVTTVAARHMPLSRGPTRPEVILT